MDNRPFIHPKDLEALRNEKQKINSSVWEKVDAHFESGSQKGGRIFFINPKFYAAASVVLLTGLIIWLNTNRSDIVTGQPVIAQEIKEQPSESGIFDDHISRGHTETSVPDPVNMYPSDIANRTLKIKRGEVGSPAYETDLNTERSDQLNLLPEGENELIHHIAELPQIDFRKEHTFINTSNTDMVNIKDYQMKIDLNHPFQDEDVYILESISESLFSIFRENEKVKKVKKKINKYKDVENIIIHW